MSSLCRNGFVNGVFFFFKQKTAYEMRISDWSSDVCSSDLSLASADTKICATRGRCKSNMSAWRQSRDSVTIFLAVCTASGPLAATMRANSSAASRALPGRSEEHTSELQSLMRISYAVFCLKKKNANRTTTKHKPTNASQQDTRMKPTKRRTT